MCRTLLLLPTVLLLAVAPAAGEGAKDTPTDFTVLPKLAEAIAKADKVTLFEGLPHQGWEPELLKKELADKKTVKFGGYPFYAEVLELKEGDGKKLVAVAGDADTYLKFGGEKKCGGYHPDYAIEFTSGAEKFYAMICFGCHEAIVIGPKASVRCDLGKLKGFEDILKGYRKNRPEKKDRE